MDSFASDLPRDYNSMTWQERRDVRNEYFILQKGLCHHCGKHLSESPARHVTDKKINLKLFPKDFLKYPIHLHHDHNTGMTIGAVHSYCNAVLWQYHGE